MIEYIIKKMSSRRSLGIFNQEQTTETLLIYHRRARTWKESVSWRCGKNRRAKNWLKRLQEETPISKARHDLPKRSLLGTSRRSMVGESRLETITFIDDLFDWFRRSWNRRWNWSCIRNSQPKEQKALTWMYKNSLQLWRWPIFTHIRKFFLLITHPASWLELFYVRGY